MEGAKPRNRGKTVNQQLILRDIGAQKIQVALYDLSKIRGLRAFRGYIPAARDAGPGPIHASRRTPHP